MDKNKLAKAIKLARELTKKRNFSQTFDLIITLKDLNIKKADDNVDIFTVLPNPRGKQVKICALVDKDMIEKAKVFDKVIPKLDFPAYKKPKDIKKLAQEYDLFVAQATIMTDIAKTFGRVLGSRGQMPNPKAGCIITPASDLTQLKQRLNNTVRIKTKNEPIIKAPLGKEELTDEQLIANAVSIYNNLTHSLPKEEHNVQDVFVKLTMGPAVKLGETKEQVEQRIKAKQESKRKQKLKEKIKETKQTRKPLPPPDESRKTDKETKSTQEQSQDTKQEKKKISGGNSE